VGEGIAEVDVSENVFNRIVDIKSSTYAQPTILEPEKTK
jgi:hypothetical protein